MGGGGGNGAHRAHHWGAGQCGCQRVAAAVMGRLGGPARPPFVQVWWDGPNIRASRAAPRALLTVLRPPRAASARHSVAPTRHCVPRWSVSRRWHAVAASLGSNPPPTARSLRSGAACAWRHVQASRLARRGRAGGAGAHNAQHGAQSRALALACVRACVRACQ
eukprot:364779-Chlamydomonas_euryale.AAC.4